MSEISDDETSLLEQMTVEEGWKHQEEYLGVDKRYQITEELWKRIQVLIPPPPPRKNKDRQTSPFFRSGLKPRERSPVEIWTPLQQYTFDFRSWGETTWKVRGKNRHCIPCFLIRGILENFRTFLRFALQKLMYKYTQFITYYYGKAKKACERNSIHRKFFCREMLDRSTKEYYRAHRNTERRREATRQHKVSFGRWKAVWHHNLPEANGWQDTRS